MAGDWMKIDLELPDKPEVHYIANVLKLDPDAVVGKLIRIWQWFDKHTTNGNAVGVTFSLPDRIAGVIGFGEAMQFAGWLIQDGASLIMPKFDKHTSESAKTRSLSAKRQQRFRNGNSNDGVTDVALPREEKKRSKPPLSPKGEKTPAVQFKSFLADCKSRNEKAIADYTPVFKYADEIGLPMEFVQLAWFEFGRQFGDGGVQETKKQADWRKTFRNYVEKNYLKLWWLKPDGGYELTTAGRTAERANAERLAA